MTNGAPQSGLSWNRIARRIRVPLGFLFAAFYFWRARPDWISLIAGALIAFLGVYVRAVASGHVKKNEELATAGPYAFCRNPLYLGSIIIAVGFAVAARDVWVAVAIVVLFTVIYVPVIRSEESFLRERFPDFDDYSNRVPRLLPHKLHFGGFARGFSRELYLQHREYNALIGAAVMLAALIVKMLWFPGSW